MITKVSNCFALGKTTGLGKVYIVLKRFKWSFTRPLRNKSNTNCGYVNLKNNTEEFQRTELQEGYGIIQNLKNGKAKCKTFRLKKGQI